MSVLTSFTVIPGLVPGIHVLIPRKDVDGRNKCGHDGCGTFTLGRAR
jgi:hypothetical protein